MWPFADPDRYRSYTRPLEEIGKGHLLSPRNLTEAQNRAELIKIDGILVFNDPRDWALDIQIILDLLLSEEGYLGSISPKNGDDSLDNRGYHQHEQPKIWFSNPDLSWAAAYHIPRLGQGSFKRALFGLWTSISQKDAHKVKILHKQYGKPSDRMFQYGENMLLWYRAQLLHAPSINPVEAKQSTHNKTAGLVEGVLGQPLKHIYMVGDNPESDVLGANSIRSKNGVGWHSVLVRTGVYESGTPAHTPNAIVDNVWDAVQWSIEDVKTATSRNAGSEGALGEKIAAPESRLSSIRHGGSELAAHALAFPARGEWTIGID
ncbi:uncharacterized protein KY384_001217 [Bacidia gigantensis]|uniref:uncharacterized protein n=1 Tax=Bacidia gigantensis TaxID=2732470 RepID=UPI001D03DE31|nr:uncharacterized protein KY384_001217 [Bacidia gigantensis]KAG8534372.1 hypothetical protein KY384_001217 [Bacidia gigantensis]